MLSIVSSPAWLREVIDLISSIFLARGGNAPVVRDEIKTVCIILFMSCFPFVSFLLNTSGPVLTHNSANGTSVLLVVM